MTELIKVCDVDALPDGEALLVPAETTGWSDGIAVFRDGGEFFALDDTCTHEEASLADGWIENGAVECPDHAARFSLATGAVLCDPATRAARTHRVEVADGCVWLAVGE
ncbi:3-phenylpropionate/trans-cinnamate dioxygenase ferredoxin subunit [Allocatelliglobosispora scoriae]|uniref:3-phenylpropionate/trans-cinnamate dioxygenase ferredoxin subunit n=1 Tax=Allocatelliglobosispora scoriae TaxID=643052 RepID=A0A841BQ45_9ACTN|nr:bifunctional 3-phenylpropionate/cinnamic acid dioxygenase ferredoxin subunit [Allocatelliglobosispora scoriae]MBB5868951.1 3-phenylpropionate/trans-cinnamate dioxygenase ferredoxin subunit [Allocatelliglobosispora scoriae]